MRSWLPCGSSGSWQSTSHTMAPAKAAIGSSRRPWNSRTPFQIMPQATKVSACAISVGNWYTGAGAPQSAIDADPSK